MIKTLTSNSRFYGNKMIKVRKWNSGPLFSLPRLKHVVDFADHGEEDQGGGGDLARARMVIGPKEILIDRRRSAHAVTNDWMDGWMGG